LGGAKGEKEGKNRKSRVDCLEAGFGKPGHAPNSARMYTGNKRCSWCTADLPAQVTWQTTETTVWGEKKGLGENRKGWGEKP